MASARRTHLRIAVSMTAALTGPTGIPPMKPTASPRMSARSMSPAFLPQPARPAKKKRHLSRRFTTGRQVRASMRECLLFFCRGFDEADGRLGRGGALEDHGVHRVEDRGAHVDAACQLD